MLKYMRQPNWPKIVEALLNTGLTEEGIADRVGKSQSAISRIKNGIFNPNYETGAALLALYDRRVKRRK